VVELNINGRGYQVDVEEDTPLLWILRDHLGLTGTKFGCGIGSCGACTVHLDGVALRSCVIPVAAAKDARITTIEGLSKDGSHPVQQAWIAEQVPQCGYCQPGIIMTVAGLLRRIPSPSDAEIEAELTNLCRCGTYPRIRRAMHRLEGAVSETRSADAKSGKTPGHDGDPEP
jgi:aerobic-type carbon monoxide dehydrogenase small subunit (CoxS/CutS family)